MSPTAEVPAATTPIPLQRCCPSHRDWTTLGEHLLVDFRNVSSHSIFDELHHAKRAGEFFHLDPADALDCAELIVRYRVVTATSPVKAAIHRSPAGRRPTRVR
jgi:hypothetical protein